MADEDDQQPPVQLPKAVSGIRPPNPLNLDSNISENWKTFRQKWRNYYILTKLSDHTHEYQVAMFLNTLGDEALKIYNGFHFTTEDNQRTVQEVIDKFDTFAIGEVNETYERFVFNNRRQKDGETFESFHGAVRNLVKSCNYCVNCVPSIIRDRLVLGIRDQSTQQSLLRERGLTLDRCVDICKASENASAQSRVFRPEVVNKLTHKPANKNKQRTFNTHKPQPTNRFTPQTRECKFCGQIHVMIKEKCPAWGKTCSKCKRKNHFVHKCNSLKGKSHNVNYVESSCDHSSDEEDWVFAVQSNPGRPVQCHMTVEKRDVIFTIDPGASVNVLPATVISDKIDMLQPTTKSLKMWNNSDVVPLGTIRLSVRNPANKHKYNVEFTIVKDELTPLLGVRAATQMGLVSFNEDNIERVNAVLVEDNYKDVFKETLGTFDGAVHLSLDDTVTPVVMPTRRVPIALRPKLKAELDRMMKLGVITPVSQPTPWVSQIAITQKRSGDLRVCLDPQELNKALRREHYTLPVLEDTLHELGNSRVFSKADLSSGYWHCMLDDESSLLTTFQTCFGRYRWLRLPFGLNVSSEIFQRKLNESLEGLPGVACIADDVLIHGKEVADHDENLKKFLVRCREKNIKLNPSKLHLRLSEITFMGHVITKDGLKSDPEKVRAINEMPAPTNNEELRRCLGLVNYLAKFIPNLTEVVTPMRNLTKKEVPWTWSQAQQDSFDKVKSMVTSTPVLSFYDPAKPLTLENDACEHGLGSVLLQEGRPVAYASRSLTDAERRYAQIEKEMLAVTFGLQKFHHYTYGRHLTVITDHKPLVAIVKKPLSKAPTRLQGLLLRTQTYNFDLHYQPGTTIPVADTLSRAPLPDKPQSETVQVNNVMFTSITDHSLSQIKTATLTDSILSELKTVIVQGWPDLKNDLSPELRTYFSYRDELTVHDGLILRGSRVVIPVSMREELKRKVHVGHMGINSCLRRAKNTVFWPLMSSDIRQYIESCDIFQKFCDKQSPEPLYMHEIPDHPWEKVGSDIFTIDGRNYLVTTDYYSNFFELDFLPDTTSETVIHKLKHHFGRHGIPRVVISDGGPQYTSDRFKVFSEKWGFTHETSSPGNSKANGAAEAAVKVAKRMMRKCKEAKEDPYLGLLNIRNTPTEGLETSPAQRLFGRNTKTQLPSSVSSLKPLAPSDTKANLTEKRLSLLDRHDRKYSGKTLSTLKPGDHVRMQPIQHGQKEWTEATVQSKLKSRTYTVMSNKGQTYRRNRQQLRLTRKPENRNPGNDVPLPGVPEAISLHSDKRVNVQSCDTPTVPSSVVTDSNVGARHSACETVPETVPVLPYTTRSGRVVKPAKKYDG